MLVSDEERSVSSWRDAVGRVVERAIEEDLSRSDMTTDALIPAGERCRAYVVSKSDGILAGVGVAAMVFEAVDSALEYREMVGDGSRVRPGDRVAVVEGSAASILRAERTALNFLQHMSGIATETARYVEQTEGTKALVLDTRKTQPGLRVVEKYAVRVGGGRNHRADLGDGFLIKDNHLALLRELGVGVGEAVGKARESAEGNQLVEVEVESVADAELALDEGADVVMLDNMSLDDMRLVVEAAGGRALIEASGGITADNVAAVAGSGVDLISIGAITHSARALDMSLEMDL